MSGWTTAARTVPLVCLAGCMGLCAETTQSSKIKTAGMGLLGTVISTEGETSVAITLRAGGVMSNLFVQLDGGDAMTITDGAAKTRLTGFKPPALPYAYMTKIPADTGGRVLRVALDRPADTPAPDSFVEVPKAFTISAPTPGAVLGHGKDHLVMRWAPTILAGSTWRVDGPCIAAASGSTLGLGQAAGRSATGDGDVAVDLRTAPLDDGGVPAPCDVVVTISRSKIGTIDKAFGEAGLFTATQQRVVTIRYEP